MSQFTNDWNGQNGAMASQQPMNMGGGMGASMPQNQMPMNGNTMANWQYQTPNQQVGAIPNVRGWKTFTPEPTPPPVRMLDGYWVESYNDIKPKDVPMDGGMHFFPQFDNSCIYAKLWTNDGQLLSFRFLPEKIEPPQQDSSQDINDILKGYEIVTKRQAEQLAEFGRKLDDIYDTIVNPVTTTAFTTTPVEPAKSATTTRAKRSPAKEES